MATDNKNALSALSETVIAKIVSQNCTRREDLDDEDSLYFSGDQGVFAIPQPLEAGGYTQSQLETIEAQLTRLELELLPLDPYLH